VKRVIGLALALVVLFAAPASAHVAVSPETVAPGESAQLTFRVPNESDRADTVSVEVALPEDAHFDFVSVAASPGWTHEETRSGDRVTSITWSGGTIAPGEFHEFSLVVGPVEGVDTLEFKAVQTYDDGEVVRWIDPTVAGEDEPEHPAPSVTVSSDAGEHAAGAEQTRATDDGVDGTDFAAFAALALAGVALVAALAALVMGRKRVPA
jgi:uncharacterized protein YcnI